MGGEIWHAWGMEEGSSLLHAKFHSLRCNVSPVRSENRQNRPLSKLNTGRLALRAMLPVKTFTFDRNQEMLLCNKNVQSAVSFESEFETVVTFGCSPLFHLVSRSLHIWFIFAWLHYLYFHVILFSKPQYALKHQISVETRGAFSCAGCLHAACAGARMAWRPWQANALNAPPA